VRLWPLIWFFLDLLALPGGLVRVLLLLLGFSRQGQRFNAHWHLKHTCPYCPAARRALRDPKGVGVCRWEVAWRAGNYGIPPHFGLKNLVTQYSGKTDLRAYKHLVSDS